MSIDLYIKYLFLTIIIPGDKMLIPTVIERSNGSEKAFDLYSRLLNDRVIFISGPINDDVANIVISELLYLDSISHEDIAIYINSPGGSVTSGLAIYDTMNHIKSDCSTIGVGLCASMGAFLLSSGKKGKRYSLENTEIMIHEVLGGGEGQATEIEIMTNHILRLRNKLNKILARNTNQTIKKINNDTKRDYYMDSKEAKEYGIVDSIIK